METARMKPKTKDLRSLEQNALEHVIFREILNHLLENGVKLPGGEKGEAIIKALCKRKFGLKMTVGGIEIDKPTSMYKTDELADLVTQVIAWAATDLQLEIEI